MEWHEDIQNEDFQEEEKDTVEEKPIEKEEDVATKTDKDLMYEQGVDTMEQYNKLDNEEKKKYGI